MAEDIMKRCTLFILRGVVGLILSLNSARAQGSLFTYQGSLTVSNGVAATGLYDMQFKLHPAASGTNQLGVTLTNANVGVANGLFTATLDFGASVFNGNPVWLEIGVRTNGSQASYTIWLLRRKLRPRRMQFTQSWRPRPERLLVSLPITSFQPIFPNLMWAAHSAGRLI